MNKFNHWAVVILTPILLLEICSPPVRANDGMNPQESTQLSSNREKQEWAKKLSTAQNTKTAFLITGIGGAVAGGVLALNGSSDVQDAKDTPGCSEDGSYDVICVDEQSRDQAQDKIDSGKSKIYLGLGVMAVGAVLTILGFRKDGEIQRLQREGKKKGFTWDFGIESTDKAVVTARLFF